MLLISYVSVTGWFRVWSVCVKAQLRVQSSPHLISSLPPSLTHLFLHASLSFFSFTIGSLFRGWEGPLGSERGFNEKSVNPRRKVAPACTNSVKIATFVIEALVMRRSSCRISVYGVNLNLPSGSFFFGFGEGDNGGEGVRILFGNVRRQEGCASI